jgi:hypothetical protein
VLNPEGIFSKLSNIQQRLIRICFDSSNFHHSIFHRIPGKFSSTTNHSSLTIVSTDEKCINDRAEIPTLATVSDISNAFFAKIVSEEKKNAS